jgi:hypothetical protein
MKNKSIIQKVSICLFCFVCFIHTLNFKAQCSLTASFTYTNGPNGQVYFTSTSTGTNSNTIFRWNFNSYPNYYGIFNGTSLSTYTQTFSNNATYKIYHGVVYTQPTYCVDSVFQLITITNATCSAVTAFSLQQLPNQSFTWNGLVSYPSNVSSVNWNWGDGTTSTSLYPTHSYAFASYYNICLTVFTTCGGIYTACTYSYLNKPTQSVGTDQIITLNIIQGAPTGNLNQFNKDQNISIFPNPNNSNFSISLDGFEIGKEVSLSVCNILGEEIFSEKIQIDNATQTKKLELFDAKSGTFFVKLNYDNKVKVTKLLIDR